MVANDADAYAATRIGIFFPADSGPPPSGSDGDLTGQCVSLDKWFFAEMCDGFPNPFAARGHARYLGDNLVAQGLATRVPAGQQKEGDVVCYIYGTYGHTGILLSGNRLFQQNANTAGAKKRVLSDGTVVYSSTVVPLYSSLGGVPPTFYRLKHYKEGSMANFTHAQEKVAAMMATGSQPGSNYNYEFSDDEINSDNLDKFLQTWLARSSTITKEMENAIADGITGVKGVIGWSGYNSPYVGKQVVSSLYACVLSWIKYKDGMAQPPSGPKYEEIPGPVFKQVTK